MHVLQDDDPGYLRWLAAHPHDFVINTTRPSRGDYLTLHRASCSTITGSPARGSTWTEGDFLKACGTRAELEVWARGQAGEALSCGLCG